MTARLSKQTFRRAIRRRKADDITSTISEPEAAPRVAETPSIDIAPNDPLIAYFSSASGAVEIDRLELDSPALRELRAAGVSLVAPLVSQGELIGLLNLGPRLSEQEYSADDRRLLNNLAAQAAPAVRVAQLVQQQEAEAREHERIEQELRVAQLIQQQFLPKAIPNLPGWQIAAHYQPAREVGGDFYDVIELPGGLLGIVVGDVTDKGVPAALVMASTHSFLRADAPRLISPAAVLERANDLLCPSIPEQMFVTCLYAVLDPTSGRLQFANAGHNLPYVRSADGMRELRATGMPLGLMPGMRYEEKETVLEPDEIMLLYSDGVVEGHNAEGEMFGFPRMAAAMLGDVNGRQLIDRLLTTFSRFSGPGHEQEDDITLVALHRSATERTALAPRFEHEQPASNGAGAVLADFTVASEEGNEMIAMQRVTEAIGALDLAPAVVEKLRTAVSEATMNAIEHGNQNRAELPVQIRVLNREGELAVQITDQGGDMEIPETEDPDIDLKLAGLQTPRGWGLFLIEHMVDEMRRSSDGQQHTVELIVYLKGRVDADAAV
ncbi:MAG TPA: SpoIIE family protein phosphatase [Thermomicrobiales bacterium]|nr:SpoIIE family protein phosphatase [Thermomicrobiales bacterium]